MNLTLQELRNEYEKSIKVQINVIDENRKKLKEAYKQANFREIKRLNSLLRVLYDEKSELEEKAYQLKKYYT